MHIPRAQDITIVGGGWSAGLVDLDKLHGSVIAVNDAAVHLPWWDHCVSMDRLWTESRLSTVVVKSMQEEPFSQIWIRKSALQNMPFESSFGRTADQVNPFECDHETDEFSRHLGILNGRNSGQCAMNLAYQLVPRRLFLVGFDLNRDPATGRAYWYLSYPWTTPQGGSSAKKYTDWAAGYNVAGRAFEQIGCEVFNVSTTSAVRAFPRITPADYLRMAR